MAAAGGEGAREMGRMRILMPRHWGTAAVLLLAALGVFQWPVPAGAQGVPDGRWTNVSRRVLAFYYGWYGNPHVRGRWHHWGPVRPAEQRIGGATHFPVLGPYDSHDPRVVDQQARWARQAGISGFIASWWGQGDFTDRGLPLLLDTAQRHGLKVTIYFETVRPPRDPTPGNAARDLLYVLDRYARHPAWLRVKGRPVVFVYTRAVGQLGLPGWQQAMDEVNGRYPGGAVFLGDRIGPQAARVFDGIHTYNVTQRTAGKSVEEIRSWARGAYPRWVGVAGRGRIACLTVIPGYDDRTLPNRKPPRPVTDRHRGETYRALWEEVIAADPDWVLITSWNEWHEGSEIEPSAQHGEAALRATAEFAPRFLALPPR